MLALTQQLQSADWSLAAWIALGAYVLGCFTTGYYLVRWRTGQDLRRLGSGSLGARNTGRLLGWPGFALAVAGDLGKGAFAVWGTRAFTSDPQLVALSMIGVVAGHIWPVQLRFHGGKGMATFIGALTVYDFRLAFAFVLLFGLFFGLMRRTVLPGLFAVLLLPAVAWGLSPEPVTANAAAEALRIFCGGGLVLVAHRKNIAEEFNLLLERRNLAVKKS